MPNSPRILNFPSKAIQKTIPREQVMVREIAKEEVVVELLKARLEEAGYETAEEGGELYVQRTGVNLRISNFPDHASVRIRAHVMLKKEISDAELNEFISKLSADSYFVNFSPYRWDDGDVFVFGSYVLYYPFGLNFPNFIFSMRRIIEGMQRMMLDHSKDGRYFSQETSVA